MWIFVKIGFRNVFRNTRRSLLTAFVIGFGLASMIITDGFMEGISENMVRTVTTGLLGEGQIHHPEFSDNFKVEATVKNYEDTLKILDKDPNLKSHTSRLVSFAMLSSPRNMKNITLYGVNPEQEPLISNIHKQIIKGQFVENETDLVIGEKLLKRLEINLGDKVVLTAAEAHTNEMTQELFRVSGVYKTGSKDQDEGLAFIHIKTAQKILRLEGQVHEVSMNFKDRSLTENKDYPLWFKLKELGNKAESWAIKLSSFVNMMAIMENSKGYTALLLMILVGFGIVNTLFMALYERMFEFAVLQALGTKPRELVYMILSEAASLGFLGVLIGFVVTALIALPMALYGIDYGGMEIAEITIREPIYYRFHPYQYIVYPLGVILFTILVSFYPAFYAARLTMAKAIKRSL